MITDEKADILDEKLKKLKKIIDGYGQMLVALSGGVDSIFLTAFAYKNWGDDRVAALTADGPHFAADEIQYAEKFCEYLGISHKTIDVSHVLPLIEDNPEDRCYICKREIFSGLKDRAEMVGSVLADGTNADDMKDYRPGMRALEELGVTSPLKEAGLTKDEIRHALKMLAYEDEALDNVLVMPQPLWNKPAFACLASRIPYGEKISEEKLQSVYRAEKLLRERGFNQVRVRHHGDVARIEVEPMAMERFFDVYYMSRINEEIKACGFKYAALDLGGYIMGGLNPERTDEDGEI